MFDLISGHRQGFVFANNDGNKNLKISKWRKKLQISRVFSIVKFTKIFINDFEKVFERSWSVEPLNYFIFLWILWDEC